MLGRPDEQHLLTRRYISAEADADVYSWVLEYRKELSVRRRRLIRRRAGGRDRAVGDLNSMLA
jgi:hypothetical protein